MNAFVYPNRTSASAPLAPIASPASLGAPRIFLLSPAFVGGQRAKLLLNPRAAFVRARSFHRVGLPLAEAFEFASGLYFRGKIAYARRFARPERGDIVRVITLNRGLMDPDAIIRPDDLLSFGATAIDAADPLYHEPLHRDAMDLAARTSPLAFAILLGSVATTKYRQVLLGAFGSRLLFPGDFVGRGDMSRGALLLNASRSGRELAYLPVHGTLLTGKRAPSISLRPVRRRKS